MKSQIEQLKAQLEKQKLGGTTGTSKVGAVSKSAVSKKK